MKIKVVAKKLYTYLKQTVPDKEFFPYTCNGHRHEGILDGEENRNIIDKSSDILKYIERCLIPKRRRCFSKRRLP